MKFFLGHYFNPFIIARTGINNMDSFVLAKNLIVSAARIGFNAVKFQTHLTKKQVKKYLFFNILTKYELRLKSFLIRIMLIFTPEAKLQNK